MALQAAGRIAGSSPLGSDASADGKLAFLGISHFVGGPQPPILQEQSQLHSPRFGRDQHELAGLKHVRTPSKVSILEMFSPLVSTLLKVKTWTFY